ncbi:hypothetical protein M409DRAFT_51190 [Zasmidium cellare ATCC 36951]|uniref:Uncharacterized protein n=1 Tax=Zasmidium cellare ATCC 36951 TaxID=1080233 RepID=A0A6A6CXH5_ZASCE|nr:uncharacterized protein M409DRAFT_51190 [Zasmidium cellare ATCC 36951]KAF2170948.1 hypothetical protein M409DRAFT_51190 [Zasmidium cellare ATCC 36951]
MADKDKDAHQQRNESVLGGGGDGAMRFPTAVNSSGKKEEFIERIEEGSIPNAGRRRPTADKGTQVTKEDIAAAMRRDREKMPPPPVPHRLQEPSITRQSSNGIASSNPARSPEQVAPHATNLSSSSTGPATQIQAGLFGQIGATRGQSPASSLLSGRASFDSASPSSSAPVNGNHTGASAPQASGPENPAQWYHRLRPTPETESSENTALRSGTSTWLLRDHRESSVSLNARQSQRSRRGCRYGCGMPGGEHGADCPGLMDTKS